MHVDPRSTLALWVPSNPPLRSFILKFDRNSCFITALLDVALSESFFLLPFCMQATVECSQFLKKKNTYNESPWKTNSSGAIVSRLLCGATQSTRSPCTKVN